MEKGQMDKFKIWILAVLTMVAFAANSLLCRAALIQSDMSAFSFSFIRLSSGAIVLFLLSLIGFKKQAPRITNSFSWKGGVSLASYVLFFSLSYNSISTGTGALLLFGSVQIALIVWGVISGEKFNLRKVIGILVATCGLIYMMLPSASSPTISSAISMVVAGVSWAFYTIEGKRAIDANVQTAANFQLATLLILCVTILLGVFTSSNLFSFKLTESFFYAILSGGVTSGVGYILWYRLVPFLAPSQSGTLQMTVPVFAGIMGWVLLGEALTTIYIISSMIVFCGLGLLIKNRE